MGWSRRDFLCIQKLPDRPVAPVHQMINSPLVLNSQLSRHRQVLMQTSNAARGGNRGREGWRLLREMCADIVELRKGDHSAERLQIERERLELEKAKSEEHIRQKLPELVKKFGTNGGSLSEEERARRMREMFGLPREKKNGLSPEALAEIERAAKLL